MADFTQYMRYELNRSVHTVSAYTRDIMQFIGRSDAPAGDFDPARVGTADVRRWLRELASAGDKSSTIRRKTQALRTFFSFIRRRGGCAVNPCDDIVLAKSPAPLPEIVAPQDMERLLREMPPEPGADHDGQRDHLIMLMLYTTGMRQAEMLSLTRRDFDPLRRELRICGKRGKQRIVPLHPEVCDRTTAYLAMRGAQEGGALPGSALFADKNGRPLNKSALYGIVKKRLATAACRKKSPHVLRHSFATAMLNNGADINTVKEYLGHASLAATQIYTHLTLRELKTNYQLAHPRAKKENRTMELQIKAIHFEIADKLIAFVNKKIEKLNRRYEDIIDAEVTFTLVKPETACNKEAAVHLKMAGENLFASKTADTFEEALDLALEALEKQLEKRKGKK